MAKYFLSVIQSGENVLVTSIDNGEVYNVPTTLLSEIAELTRDEEAALELFTYFNVRLTSYLDSLELQDYDADANKIIQIFTPSVIAEILKEVLKRVHYDDVIDVLDKIQDTDLFEGCSILQGVTIEDIIDYLVGVIGDLTDAPFEAVDADEDAYYRQDLLDVMHEEENFNNSYHYVRG